MRIAIVDDLPEDRERLLADICRWAMEADLPLVPPPALFSTGEEFLKNTEDDSYDIIFLDIYMPGINGMDTAKQLRNKNRHCRIIFTTQTPDFAVESYDVDSSYYLLKPYSYEKLANALQRCNASFLEEKQFVTFTGRSETIRLYLHDITYTEYTGRHVTVHMRDGSTRSLSIRQRDFADTLLEYPYFCDCMKGILVNFEAVASLEKDCFLLKDSTRPIPISRLKYPGVREKFLEYTYAKVRGYAL